MPVTTPFIDSLQAVNRQFVQLLDDLSALRALARLNLSVPSEEHLLGDALRALMENSDIARCSVYLRRADRLVYAAGSSWDELLGRPAAERPQAAAFALGEGLVGLAAETGNLQHCTDCRRDPAFADSDGGGGSGTLMVAPIGYDDQILGVVNAWHPDAGHFTRGHEQLLQLFATFLGQMLANWRYYHRMEQEVQRRTRELESALASAEQLKQRYQQLSVIDELTGIHNRRFFFPEASAALANAVRHRHDFTIMMVDLDRFKEVNDTYGHAMGDKVLQVAAALLKGQTREGDLIARFGGEEFVLALPNTDIEGARQLADRVLESLRGIAFSAEDTRLQITASIGYACLTGEETPEQPDLLEQLLRKADHALYHCKACGRDQAWAYSELPGGT